MHGRFLWAGFGEIKTRMENESAPNTGTGGKYLKYIKLSTGIIEEVWNMKHKEDEYNQL